MAFAGVEEAGVPFRFVAEQKQAFTVGVEAADGINLGRESKVRQSGPVRALFWSELRKDAVGLMEGEKHRKKKSGMKRACK